MEKRIVTVAKNKYQRPAKKKMKAVSKKVMVQAKEKREI